MQYNAIPWLLIVLKPRLTLSWLEADLGPGFVLGEELFESVSDTDLTGFYDRLYTSSGEFVGIQITPLAIPELPEEVSALPYVRSVMDDRQLQILFKENVLDELTEVTDQAFGGRMYRSLGGEIAVTLDAYFLEDSERALIARSQFHWATVRLVGD
jgi:hypothetical protein